MSLLPSDLSAAGWASHPDDICWLDCDRPGYRKTHRGREIRLCVPHATKLEAGTVRGVYEGAPLPLESMAAEWPWRPAEVIDPALAIA